MIQKLISQLNKILKKLLSIIKCLNQLLNQEKKISLKYYLQKHKTIPEKSFNILQTTKTYPEVIH